MVKIERAKISSRGLIWLLLGLAIACPTKLLTAQPSGWRDVSSVTGNDLTGVAYGLGRLVAVGDAGTIITSTDGYEWESVDFEQNEIFRAVCFGGNRFVATSDRGLFLSLDGLTWFPVFEHPDSDSFSQIEHFNGKFYVAGGKLRGSWYLHSSEDGISWTTEEIASEVVPTIVRGVLGFNDRLFIYGRGQKPPNFDGDTTADPVVASRSIDMNDWNVELRQPLTGFLVADFDNMAIHNGEVFTASSRLIYKKKNGIWENILNAGTDISFAALLSWKDVLYAFETDQAFIIDQMNLVKTDFIETSFRVLPGAFSTFGDRLILVGKDGLIGLGNKPEELRVVSAGDAESSEVASFKGLFIKSMLGRLHVSSDGIFWNVASEIDSSVYEPILASESHVITFLGSQGNAIYSLDGFEWHQTDLPVSSPVNDVIWTGEDFYAVGSGFIITSSDGLSWTRELVPTAGNLRLIVKFKSKLYAFTSSQDDVYFVSEGNGIWSSVPFPDDFPIGSNTINGAATDGEKLLLAGEDIGGRNGGIAMTQDFEIWTLVRNGAGSSKLIYDGNIFLRYTPSFGRDLYYSVDGLNWEEDEFQFPRDNITVSRDGRFVTGSDGNAFVSTDLIANRPEDLVAKFSGLEALRKYLSGGSDGSSDPDGRLDLLRALMSGGFSDEVTVPLAIENRGIESSYSLTFSLLYVEGWKYFLREFDGEFNHIDYELVFDNGEWSISGMIYPVVSQRITDDLHSIEISLPEKDRYFYSISFSR